LVKYQRSTNGYPGSARNAAKTKQGLTLSQCTSICCPNIRLREVNFLDHPDETICISTKKDMPLWQIYLLSSNHEHSFHVINPTYHISVFIIFHLEKRNVKTRGLLSNWRFFLSEMVTGHHSITLVCEITSVWKGRSRVIPSKREYFSHFSKEDIICFFLDSPAGYVCMYVCCPGGFSIFAILT